jgi:hypothetical protein
MTNSVSSRPPGLWRIAARVTSISCTSHFMTLGNSIDLSPTGIALWMTGEIERLGKDNRPERTLAEN